MWDSIFHGLRVVQEYVVGMGTWDWVWVCAVAVLIGGWSLQSMPQAGSR